MNVAGEIDFNHFKKTAKDSLIKHLSNIIGLKLIVVEDRDFFDLIYYLLSPPEIVKFGLSKILYFHKNIPRVYQNHVLVFIIKPNLESIDKIIDIELNSKNLLPRTKHRIYLTQKPDSFGEALQLKLKENNLENFFHIENLNINLIALDNNILTMDLDLKYCLKSLYLENKSSDSDKDRQSIYKQIAESINLIESIYGTISDVHLIGSHSQEMFKKKDKKDSKCVSKFGTLIVVDRKFDFITPFLIQTNYEGALDDKFMIKYCKATISINDHSLHLNDLTNENPFFKELRYMPCHECRPKFIEIQKILNSINETNSKSLNREIEKINKEVLKKRIELKEKPNHLGAYCQITKADENNPGMLSLLSDQLRIISIKGKNDIYEYIKSLITTNSNKTHILNLMVIYSLVNNAQKEKERNVLKEMFLKECISGEIGYFSKIMENLEKLYKEINNSLTFDSLKILIQEKPKEALSKYFNNIYKPILCRCIKKILSTYENYSSSVIKTNIKAIFKPKLEDTLKAEYEHKMIKKETTNKPILIFFLGGCTYSEIATLSILHSLKNYNFYIVTTSIINSKRIIKALSE